ncbi:MAG: hypothetical protein H0T88_10290 [Lysobacter sp.]|nr:hypothetical protein [Lysobacter sp.]
MRFAELIRTAALTLHDSHHSTDPTSGKRVSFGLVRMANIEPLCEVALSLYKLGLPPGRRIHLCTYHSQFPLVLRSAIERRLDAALNRKDAKAVFQLPYIRQRIDAHQEADHLFIVLGSPVTEVGRDHDYDWAVVEPSSMRSLIQLAGRVRRHRDGECLTPNLMVFETNLRHFTAQGKPAFCRPGFESERFPLASHQLQTLLAAEQLAVIDARPRIVAPAPECSQPGNRLVDLEHARMRHTMLPSAQAVSSGRRVRRDDQAGPQLNAANWWSLPPVDAVLTGVLPQQQPFRFDPIQRVDWVLRLTDDGDDYDFVQLLEVARGRFAAPDEVVLNSLHYRIPDSAVQGVGIVPWGHTDYFKELNALADELGLPLAQCALHFGRATLPDQQEGWSFHPVLGFSRFSQACQGPDSVTPARPSRSRVGLNSFDVIQAARLPSGAPWRVPPGRLWRLARCVSGAVKAPV